MKGRAYKYRFILLEVSIDTTRATQTLKKGYETPHLTPKRGREPGSPRRIPPGIDGTAREEERVFCRCKIQKTLNNEGSECCSRFGDVFLSLAKGRMECCHLAGKLVVKL